MYIIYNFLIFPKIYSSNIYSEFKKEKKKKGTIKTETKGTLNPTRKKKGKI